MVPVDLPSLLRKGRHQVRTLGRSPAGDSAAYPPVTLTAAQRAEYYREGYVIVRDVVPQHLLDTIMQGLFRDIGPASWPWVHNSFMMVDEVLDFYIFSNVPALVAQLAGEPLHFWSDFHYFRSPRGTIVSTAHVDELECEGLLPANATVESRVRAWITLEDDVPAPVLVNQSTVLSRLSEIEKQEFLSGALKHVKPLDFYYDANRWQQPIARQQSYFTAPKGLRKGDVLLHSPCLLHASPPPFGRTAPFLCPTYAPGTSRVHVMRAGSPGRLCKSGLQLGDAVGDRGNPCFPQVLPVDAGLRPGTRLSYEAADYDGLDMALAWLGHRFVRIWRDWMDPVEDSRGEEL